MAWQMCMYSHKYVKVGYLSNISVSFSITPRAGLVPFEWRLNEEMTHQMQKCKYKRGGRYSISQRKNTGSSFANAKGSLYATITQQLKLKAWILHRPWPF